MKRVLSLTLVLIVILNLCGCFFSRNGIKEPVTFYYTRASSEFVYGAEDGVIASETREASGHRDNLRYLLAFYLIGPADKELSSPLPRGTVLYALEQETDSVTITLSDTSASLSDSEFSLACACLSMTCMELVPAEEVTVASGSRSLTLRRDNLILTDTLKPEEDKK